MTKKELLEAIKDMPEDAEVWIDDNTGYDYPASKVEVYKETNEIIIL